MKKSGLIKLGVGVVMALGMASGALAGIAATKHNLSTSGTAGNHMTAGTGADEICVFCHTPHGSNTNVKAPLWNKPTNGGAYTTYNTGTSSTIDGAVDMAGVSLACLSCHDGTQAMDTMINRPGSGLWTSDMTGATLAGGAWSGSATMPAGITNLGTDLTNDHPVGIQYCGGGINSGATSAGASAGSCTDGDFNAPLNASISSNRVWWVETGGNATRSKTDLPLYARVYSGAYQPFVECASCHDPHVSGTSTFLRISNAASAVCLACHNK